jgi:hypothetical protein
MAESVKPSEDPPVAVDLVGGDAFQRVKISVGPDGGPQVDVSAADHLPTVDAAAIAVLEAIATLLGGTLKVSDGGGPLTVDGTVTITDGSGPVSVDGTVAIGSLPELPAGTHAIGKLAANSGVDIGDVDVTSLPELPAGSKAIGKVGLDPPSSTGLTPYRSLDLDETEEAIKAGAGKLFGYYLYNDGAATVYVKIYNATEAEVVVGTTVPVITIPLPPKSAANVEFTNGIAFAKAITAAATTGFADADVGAPANNQVIANFFFA